MRCVVSEKGQVTIPKELRDRLGIQSGQILEFRERRGELVALKVNEEDPIDALRGLLKGEINSTDAWMGELRGDVDV